MDPISKFVLRISANDRRKRAELFLHHFNIDESTKILDLGSENGTNIYNVLRGTNFNPDKVYIADIDEAALREGEALYGFNTILIDEGKKLPFDDKFFDIVYCSSVIEHVTVPKSELWNFRNGKKFATASFSRQEAFAKEIVRLGKGYFVQTPCKTFPVESHTWLPLMGYLPRRVFLSLLKVSNRFWIKKADPDFNLLGRKDMERLFADGGRIIVERKFGFIKSVMAVKTL